MDIAVGIQAVETAVGKVAVLVGTVASAVVGTQAAVGTVVVDKVMVPVVGRQAAGTEVGNQAVGTEVDKVVVVDIQVVVEQVVVDYRTVVPTSLDYSFSIYFLIASVGPGIINPSWNPTDNMNIHAPNPTWSRNSTASSWAS